MVRLEKSQELMSDEEDVGQYRAFNISSVVQNSLMIEKREYYREEIRWRNALI